MAPEAIQFLGEFGDELFPERPPTLDVETMSCEEIFKTFCSERVGIRRTFLTNHFAAFAAADMAKWFSSRTNATESK